VDRPAPICIKNLCGSVWGGDIEGDDFGTALPLNKASVLTLSSRTRRIVGRFQYPLFRPENLLNVVLPIILPAGTRSAAPESLRPEPNAQVINGAPAPPDSSVTPSPN